MKTKYHHSHFLPSFHHHLLNPSTVPSILKSSHSLLITSGLISPFLNSHISHRCRIQPPTTTPILFSTPFLFNTILTTYSIHGCHPSHSLHLYSLMLSSSVLPDSYTFSPLLKICTSISYLPHGSALHAAIFKTGFAEVIFLKASLLHMYSQCGSVNSALNVFHEIPENDIVSYTAMLTACAHAGIPSSSFHLFRRMQSHGIRADAVSLIAISVSISLVGNSYMARSAHAFAIRKYFLNDDDDGVALANSMISMYCRNGEMDIARRIFNNLYRKDTISWNIIMGGYLKQKNAIEVSSLFEKMTGSSSPNPDEVTLLLLASSYAELGYKVHDFTEELNRVERGIPPLKLMNAVMHMHGKCGDVDSAMKIFNQEIRYERRRDSWNVVISGLGMNGRGEEAVGLFYKMLKQGVVPDHVTFVAVLSACAHSGLVEDGWRCFRMMERYSVEVEEKHYVCMVSMLGRVGMMQEAYDLIKEMGCSGDVWAALMLGCREHGEVGIGEVVGGMLLGAGGEGGHYALVSNMYAGCERWEDAARVRGEGRRRGAKKNVGLSWIEVEGAVQLFHNGGCFSRDVFLMIQSLVGTMR